MAANATRQRIQWWIWNLSLWLGVGLFAATETVLTMRSEGMHHNWPALFFVLLVSRLPWAFATPVVLRLQRQYPSARLRELKTWLVHLSACIATTVVVASWNALLEKMLNPWAYSTVAGPFPIIWQNNFYAGILESIFLYTVILITGQIIESRDRLLREETEKAHLSEQLAKAQLSALRRQIEPHFLFNALNSIAAQVRDGSNDSAVTMIAALSDVLRSVIADSNRQEVTLGQEIELLQKYLEIQKVRFGDRLQVMLDIPSELSFAMVPSFILQPVVENAIKHGIAKRARGGAIEVTALRMNGLLTLSVYNDGPTLPTDWQECSSGVGLSNLRQRLRGLYGDSYEFSIRNRASSGVEVSVSVPFRGGLSLCP
jgi:two-component sensor histidine kinase